MKESLTISCDLGCLPEIRKFVQELLAQNKLPEIEAHKIVLAVDEVCANLIIHANSADPDKEIFLSAEVIPQEKVTFVIKDQGVAFDLTEYQEPSLDSIISQKRKGGLGLILVRKIMDKVEFKTDETYNICRLLKNLK